MRNQYINYCTKEIADGIEEYEEWWSGWGRAGVEWADELSTELVDQLSKECAVEIKDGIGWQNMVEFVATMLTIVKIVVIDEDSME
jgi:hypothetical protein